MFGCITFKLDRRQEAPVTTIVGDRSEACGQYRLYGRNLPDIVTFTRSPFWSG